MPRYQVTVPPTWEQGSYKIDISVAGSIETVAQVALFEYNSARAHDGLPPLKRMPKGTKYTKMSGKRFLVRFYQWINAKRVEDRMKVIAQNEKEAVRNVKSALKYPDTFELIEVIVVGI